jgi:Type II secretion system (T2SS), protein L
MTTLRVLVDAEPSPGRGFAYALVDGNGRAMKRGRGDASQWPAADRRIAIVDAPLVLVAAPKLPPIGAARLGEAVRYALDDQAASAADAMHIAHGAQRADGHVVAIALARSLMRAIVAELPAFDRIVALPTLLPPTADWQWARLDDGHGFLLRPGGSALATGAADAPPEIALAIGQARRAARAPARIVVRAGEAHAALPASAIDAVPIVAGARWNWDGSAGDDVDADAAPDLRQGEFAPAAALRGDAAAMRARWRPAIVLASIAVAWFALAALGSAAWYAFDAWRDDHAARELAHRVGAESSDFAGAIAAIGARYADARHAAREAAPTDALPLLARAAPALAGVPPGKWRRAVYASGAWTFEFAPLDAATRDALVARLSAAGLTPLTADSAAGLRLRVQA